MSKRKSMILIMIFLTITIMPHIAYFLVGEYIDTENYENRDMSSRPVLTVKNYETFPEEYEAYYNDNIPFRKQLIQGNNSIDYFLFKQSSSDDVVIGKDGWLFYTGGTNPVEQSLGYWDLFTDAQLKTIADNLMSTKRVLESEGIEFVLFVAPNKETIYKEKIPDYYELKNETTCTGQLVKYLKENTDIRVVYPKEELLWAKSENPDRLLYHKLDTHWNYAGAYIGAVSLAKELGIDMPSIDEINLEPIYGSTGDLTGMLNISVKNGNLDYNVSGISSLETENEKYDFASEFIYHTPDADSRDLFVWRDSFSTSLAPSIATQFENSVFIHRDAFNIQQIFDYKSDIFVLEIVERNIRDLEQFRVSRISYSVENLDNGMKNITISPAINDIGNIYVSISKKSVGHGTYEKVKKLKLLEKPIKLQVLADEIGELFVDIYKDESPNNILEQVIVQY